MTTVGVLVATFGSTDWARKGEEAALVAAETSGADCVDLYHGSGLAEARNHLAENSTEDYICFLDADDRLQEGYVDAFRDKYLDENLDLLYKPSTLGWYKDGTYDEELGMIRSDNLARSNEMVIGTIVRREKFPGFDPDLEALEDWDLFLRMYKNGARIRECHDMVYVVGVNEDSRNQANQTAAYQKVIRKHGLRGTSLSPERV